MKVKLFGEVAETQELLNKVQQCLDELGLVDFIEVEQSSDEALKTKLNILKVPALIIEEQSIDFQDMIFEGIVPSDEELKSMFVSIIGGESGGSCGSKGDDGSCGTGCGCH